jgi:uncharacterized protein (DUF433 family)
MKEAQRIVIDERIQHGKPVIRGTRVPVARVIAELAGGMSREDLMKEYGLTLEDISAALASRADLKSSYAAMAKDGVRERDAHEWAEQTASDLANLIARSRGLSKGPTSLRKSLVKSRREDAARGK